MKKKRNYFKVVEDYEGDDWLVCFGRDAETNKEYYITTDRVNASWVGLITWSAKEDAEFIAKKFNERAEDILINK